MFWFLVFQTGVKKCNCSWGDHVQWSCPDMVDNIYDIYRICMGTTHCATLGTSAEFWKKGTHQKEWCKLLKKARTANPSATTMLAVAQWQMSCLWKDLNTRKQHVENISQMCVKNSWGEAHYHATCRRDYTREDDRHQETIKDTKTIEEQASNKTILTLFSVHHSVCYGQNHLEIKRLPR